jgi:hypothetical protein
VRKEGASSGANKFGKSQRRAVRKPARKPARQVSAQRVKVPKQGAHGTHGPPPEPPSLQSQGREPPAPASGLPVAPSTAEATAGSELDLPAEASVERVPADLGSAASPDEPAVAESADLSVVQDPAGGLTEAAAVAPAGEPSAAAAAEVDRPEWPPPVWWATTGACLLTALGLGWRLRRQPA